jgi:hypothetical protein
LLFFSSLANKHLVLPFSRALTITMFSIKHIMHYNRICNYSIACPSGHLYYAVTIIPTLTYNWANSAIIQKDLILNIMHSTFNLPETEAVIWILSVILKRDDGFNHYLNIRQYTMPSYDIIVSQ